MSHSMKLAAQMLANAKRDLDVARADHAAAIKAMQNNAIDMRQARKTVRQAYDAMVTAAESRGDIDATEETLREAQNDLRPKAAEEKAIKDRCATAQDRVTRLEAEYRNALKRVEDAALEMVGEPTHA